ncbi:hypothetical protein P9112_011006 [Eukaryota sp. TZLM1-RC]
MIDDQSNARANCMSGSDSLNDDRPSPSRPTDETLSTPPLPAKRLLSVSSLDGSFFINQYQVRSLLANGNNNVRIYCARSRTKDVAIKVFNTSLFGHSKSEAQRSMIRSEIAIMKKLSHPNVVPLIEAIEDPQKSKVYLVMEYFSKGPVLSDNLRSIVAVPPYLVWSYFRDALLGLDYLHQQGILHRDLKPSNLLISLDNRVKISDFGCSHQLEHNEDDTLRRSTKNLQDCTSPVFSSPEVVEGLSQWNGKASDVWALGITLYIMAFGKLPFHHPSILELFNLICTQELDFPPDVDPLLRNLLELMLCKDFTQRASIKEIKQHPWVTDEGQCPISDCHFPPISVDDNDLDNAVQKLESNNENVPKSNSLVRVDSSSEASRRSSFICRTVQSPPRLCESSRSFKSRGSSILDISLPRSLDLCENPDLEVDSPVTDNLCVTGDLYDSDVKMIDSDQYDFVCSSDGSVHGPMFSSDEESDVF